MLGDELGVVDRPGHRRLVAPVLGGLDVVHQQPERILLAHLRHLGQMLAVDPLLLEIRVGPHRLAHRPPGERLRVAGHQPGIDPRDVAQRVGVGQRAGDAGTGPLQQLGRDFVRPTRPRPTGDLHHTGGVERAEIVAVVTPDAKPHLANRGQVAGDVAGDRSVELPPRGGQLLSGGARGLGSGHGAIRDRGQTGGGVVLGHQRPERSQRQRQLAQVLERPVLRVGPDVGLSALTHIHLNPAVDRAFLERPLPDRSRIVGVSDVGGQVAADGLLVDVRLQPLIAEWLGLVHPLVAPGNAHRGDAELGEQVVIVAVGRIGRWLVRMALLAVVAEGDDEGDDLPPVLVGVDLDLVGDDDHPVSVPPLGQLELVGWIVGVAVLRHLLELAGHGGVIAILGDHLVGARPVGADDAGESAAPLEAGVDGGGIVEHRADTGLGVHVDDVRRGDHALPHRLVGQRRPEIAHPVEVVLPLPHLEDIGEEVAFGPTLLIVDELAVGGLPRDLVGGQLLHPFVVLIAEGGVEVVLDLARCEGLLVPVEPAVDAQFEEVFDDRQDRQPVGVPVAIGAGRLDHLIRLGALRLTAEAVPVGGVGTWWRRRLSEHRQQRVARRIGGAGAEHRRLARRGKGVHWNLPSHLAHGVTDDLGKRKAWESALAFGHPPSTNTESTGPAIPHRT